MPICIMKGGNMRVDVIAEFLKEHCVPNNKWHGVSPEELAKMLECKLDAYDDYLSDMALDARNEEPTKMEQEDE